MIRPFVMLTALGLAACDTAPERPVLLPEPPVISLIGTPDRPLPVLGRIDATYDGQPVLWQTLDFSLGAIDPSASIRRYDDVVSIFVGGHLPGQDFEEFDGWLRIEADLPQGAAPGGATNISIAVIDTRGADAPRYVSGPGAALEITRIERPTAEFEVFGPVAGTFSARLCRAESGQAAPDPSDCKDISGAFETQASFESLR